MPKPRAWRVARVRFRRWLRKIDREPPEWLRWLTPWGTSLVLHALLLLVLGLAVYVNKGFWVGEPDRESAVALAAQLRDDVTSTEPSDQAGDPFTKLSSDLPPSLSLQPDPTAEAINVPTLPPNFRLGDRLELEAPAPAESKGAGKGGSGGRGAGGQGKGGALIAPYSGRSGDMKAMLVRREGGTVESEKAVERGLEWLGRHQRKDGSWSLDPSFACRPPGCPQRSSMTSDFAATGLAILPMLGAGHTHTQKGRYQQSLLRGLRWLVKHQRRDGELYSEGNWNAAFYSHAIASMALCEAYGITKDPSLKKPAQKAINYIVHTQNREDGGWRYYVGQPGDTSVFGWQLFALRSASLAGLSVPKLTVRRCRMYLDLAAGDPGGTIYTYQPGKEVRPVMSAVGLLCRQYLGWNRNTPSLLQGASLMMADLEADHQPNIYYWYYATQVLHNMHGKDWKRWNEFVREALIHSQVRRDEGCDRGSWDPESPSWDRWTLMAGRHYLTSLSLLTLEVYYRYLPLYRERDGAINGDEGGALDTEAQLAEGQEPSSEKSEKDKGKPPEGGRAIPAANSEASPKSKGEGEPSEGGL